jgi:N-acetylglucosamine kinase-like BadF-type ATPase
VKTYLGVDGGGSKTRFLLIDDSGRVLGDHTEGPAYYLETGMSALAEMLAHGIARVLEHADVGASEVAFAFFGLPAYGEDSSLLPTLDALPSSAIPPERYRCGNDMICGWAGALAGMDGINVVAGTGSIAYGEHRGRKARAGGWGELFSDEGSAYWLAREGLTLFSRMSDGRSPRGPLYDLLRGHFRLEQDLDLCAAIYGKEAAQRSRFAQLSKIVAQAAESGDAAARSLFTRAAHELADLVDAVRLNLEVTPQLEVLVSCTGGLFESRQLLLAPLEAALAAKRGAYRLVPARLPPGGGAALYAAMLHESPLDKRAVMRLDEQLRGG